MSNNYIGIGDDANSYVDTKNAIMLSVLGLYETVELMTSRGSNKTQYQIKVIDNEPCFCFDDFSWPLAVLLSTTPMHILDILTWNDGVMNYVD